MDIIVPTNFNNMHFNFHADYTDNNEWMAWVFSAHAFQLTTMNITVSF